MWVEVVLGSIDSVRYASKGNRYADHNINYQVTEMMPTSVHAIQF